MQQVKGNVDVTNGSASVVGNNTAWTTDGVQAGDLFIIRGAREFYYVGSVDSETGITLTATYQGPTAAGIAYVIARDYTTNLSLPEINKGDVDTAQLVTDALRKLDARAGYSVLLYANNLQESHTGDTAEHTHRSITVPGGMLGVDGSLIVIAKFSMTGSVNQKRVKIDFGGTTFFNHVTTDTTHVSAVADLEIHNRNAENLQVSVERDQANTVFSAVALKTGSVDTTIDKTLDIIGQLALGSETISLESVIVAVQNTLP